MDATMMDRRPPQSSGSAHSNRHSRLPVHLSAFNNQGLRRAASTYRCMRTFPPQKHSRFDNIDRWYALTYACFCSHQENDRKLLACKSTTQCRHTHTHHVYLVANIKLGKREHAHRFIANAHVFGDRAAVQTSSAPVS